MHLHAVVSCKHNKTLFLGVRKRGKCLPVLAKPSCTSFRYHCIQFCDWVDSVDRAAADNKDLRHSDLNDCKNKGVAAA